MSAVSDKQKAPPVADTTGAPVTADSRAQKLQGGIRALRQACRQIVGIPDYDRYVAHMAKHHPGDAVLSREEFFARTIDHKYGRNGPRCC